MAQILELVKVCGLLSKRPILFGKGQTRTGAPVVQLFPPRRTVQPSRCPGLKLGHPKKEAGSSSNHPFSGANLLLVSGRVIRYMVSNGKSPTIQGANRNYFPTKIHLPVDFSSVDGRATKRSSHQLGFQPFFWLEISPSKLGVLDGCIRWGPPKMFFAHGKKERKKGHLG